MDTAALNAHFGIPGILTFDEHNGLTRANITTPAAAATIYLQGAHITHFQPAGQPPVLFISRRSDFTPGKPIRGGIPICFPWFATDTGNHDHGRPGPSHGFARIQPWTLAFAALSGDDLHLTFTLAPTELSRSFGFDGFQLVYQVTVGRSLSVELAVANHGPSPLHFEQALHSYLHVVDVHEVSVTGLEATPYIDKVDNFSTKPAANAPLVVGSATDRIYQGTTATCVLTDSAARRRLSVEKHNSQTTVVWNPWIELSAKLADLGPDDWHEFLCIETANVGDHAITLAPGATHSMKATIGLHPGLET